MSFCGCLSWCRVFATPAALKTFWRYVCVLACVVQLTIDIYFWWDYCFGFRATCGLCQSQAWIVLFSALPASCTMEQFHTFINCCHAFEKQLQTSLVKSLFTTEHTPKFGDKTDDEKTTFWCQQYWYSRRRAEFSTRLSKRAACRQKMLFYFSGKCFVGPPGMNLQMSIFIAFHSYTTVEIGESFPRKKTTSLQHTKFVEPSPTLVPHSCVASRDLVTRVRCRQRHASSIKYTCVKKCAWQRHVACIYLRSGADIW